MSGWSKKNELEYIYRTTFSGASMVMYKSHPASSWELCFGFGEKSAGLGWFIGKDDLDELITALTYIKKEVYENSKH